MLIMMSIMKNPTMIFRNVVKPAAGRIRIVEAVARYSTTEKSRVFVKACTVIGMGFYIREKNISLYGESDYIFK